MKTDTDILIYPHLHSPDGSEHSIKEWQTARERILGYLDALGVEPLESLALSRHVLEKTKNEMTPDDGRHPVTESMRLLRQILIEQNRIDVANGTRNPMKFHILPSFPDHNRGIMMPQKLDSSLWRLLRHRTRKFFRFRWITPYIGGILIGRVFYFFI